MLFIWAKYTFKYRLNIGYGFINSIRRKQNLYVKHSIFIISKSFSGAIIYEHI